MNVFLGFPLGGLLSLSIMVCAALVLLPRGHRGEHARPGRAAGGGRARQDRDRLRLARLRRRHLRRGLRDRACPSATPWRSSTAGSGASSCAPLRASRFHLLILVSTLLAVAVLLTTVDPIKVTEYSVVFSAVALPLTYFPILVVANDPDYMGVSVNGRLANALGMVYLVILTVASLAALPLDAHHEGRPMTDSADRVPRKPTGETSYDAALRLLDRQVIDSDGAFVCNVDDLEVDVPATGPPRVVALLTGPGVLGSADRRVHRPVDGRHLAAAEPGRRPETRADRRPPHRRHRQCHPPRGAPASPRPSSPTGTRGSTGSSSGRGRSSSDASRERAMTLNDLLGCDVLTADGTTPRPRHRRAR